MARQRLFIALPLDDTVQAQLAAIAAACRAFIARASWVKQGNYHLTLRFLGATEPALIPRLQERCHALATPFPPLHGCLTSLGVFPDWRRPRVLWYGTKLDPDPAPLVTAFEQMAREFGYPPERKEFRSHITLARIKATHPGALAGLKATWPRRAEIVNDRFIVNHIVLYQSRLTPTGAVYTPIAKFPLEGGGNSHA